jgi:hypothetical protein
VPRSGLMPSKAVSRLSLRTFCGAARCTSVKVSSLCTSRSACTQHRACWPTANCPAAALAPQAGPGRFGGVIHAAGFDGRAALQPLQPRDLLTQFGFFRSSSAIFANKPATSSFSWPGDRTSRSSGGLTHSLNRTRSHRIKRKMRRCPGFCPCYFFSMHSQAENGLIRASLLPILSNRRKSWQSDLAPFQNVAM